MGLETQSYLFAEDRMKKRIICAAFLALFLSGCVASELPRPELPVH